MEPFVGDLNMGEHYTEREIIIRLTKVEKICADRQSTIDRLCSKVMNLENELRLLKSSRADALANLGLKIAAIEQQIAHLNLSEPPVATSTKEILILGDSIIKHLDAAKISDKKTDLKCIPGAQCDDLLRALATQLKSTNYKHIICHVGTNYIPQHDPRYVSNKLKDFLASVRMMAPSSQITWSPILPKTNDSLKRGINEINKSIFDTTHLIKKLNSPFNHTLFFKDRKGQVNSRLFCKDGVHLSHEGVAALENSFKWHIQNK